MSIRPFPFTNSLTSKPWGQDECVCMIGAMGDQSTWPPGGLCKQCLITGQGAEGANALQLPPLAPQHRLGVQQGPPGPPTATTASTILLLGGPLPPTSCTILILLSLCANSTDSTQMSRHNQAQASMSALSLCCTVQLAHCHCATCHTVVT